MKGNKELEKAGGAINPDASLTHGAVGRGGEGSLRVGCSLREIGYSHWGPSVSLVFASFLSVISF